MSSFADAAVRHIGDQTLPLWWPGWTSQLVNHVVLRDGIDLASYSTSAWLTSHREQPDQLDVVTSGLQPQLQTTAESPSHSVRLRYESLGHQFWSPNHLGWRRALACFEAALDLLAQTPGLPDDISPLARRSHLLVPPDDAYDVSFSEPTLPFSLFVSVPQSDVKRCAWRIAEAVLHEASHLRLSLLERVVPLISDPAATHYSPWRKVRRPLGGVLHGLYVFGVIADWYASSSDPMAGASRRLEEIQSDFNQLVDFPDLQGLTEAGAMLARNVFTRTTAAVLNERNQI